LAQRMKEIYEEYDRYDSQKIRQQCSDKFSVDSVCKQIEQLYREV